MTVRHRAGSPVPAVLLKTISMGFVACGLIFKGLSPSTMPLGHELEAEWLRAVSVSNGCCFFLASRVFCQEF